MKEFLFISIIDFEAINGLPLILMKTIVFRQ